jgi:hypothetical protein
MDGSTDEANRLQMDYSFPDCELGEGIQSIARVIVLMAARQTLRELLLASIE